MFSRRFSKRFAMLLLAPALALPASLNAADEAKTADLLIKLLKTGRSVVSDNQTLINDPSLGDKGFTPDIMAEQTMERYKASTGIDLNELGPRGRAALLWTLLESQKEVVADFQPVINKRGIGFKGVLPAKFARLTGEKFYEKTGIRLKLTSLDYRFPANRPDTFEADVLKLFTDPRYPRGKDYSKVTTVGGTRVLRVMSPEYASASCLACHGTPQGERDITGGRKEGWQEGDLGGAISLIMPVK